MNSFYRFTYLLLVITASIKPVYAQIGIIVNKAIFSDIAASIDSYISDIESIEKKTVWMNSFSFSSQSTKEDLRDSLLWHYQNSNLEGAVLIGDLPVIWCEGDNPVNGYRFFPSDYYFMDLDGIWEDKFKDGEMNGNAKTGYYDTHTGDFKPEIWVSRIVPSTLSKYGSEIGIIKSYFERVARRMRAEDKDIPKRALVIGNSDEFYNSFNDSLIYELGYDNRNIKCVPRPFDTPDKFKTELRSGYEYIRLVEHTSPSFHVMVDGNFTTADYMAMKGEPGGISRANFYELFACSACRYTEENIGACYAYCHNGLISIGLTKPESSLMPDYYFELLSKGLSFGDAYKNALDSVVFRGFVDEFSYAMLGAGTLKFKPYYPQRYSSVTTPVQKLDYGYVPCAGNESKKIVLTNNGTNAATISAIKSSNPLFFVNVSVPITISAGDSEVIECKYSPLMSKKDSGFITIKSDAVDYPEIVIPVQGIGIDMSIYNSSGIQLYMSHGGNPEDLNISPNIEIVNNGNEEITLSDIRIDYYFYDYIKEFYIYDYFNTTYGNELDQFTWDYSWCSLGEIFEITFSKMEKRVEIGDRVANMKYSVNFTSDKKIIPGEKVSLQFTVHIKNWANGFHEDRHWSYVTDDNKLASFVTVTLLPDKHLFGVSPEMALNQDTQTNLKFKKRKESELITLSYRNRTFISGLKKSGNIKVYDPLGKTVYKKVITGNEESIVWEHGNLGNGLYIISFQSLEGNTVVNRRLFCR